MAILFAALAFAVVQNAGALPDWNWSVVAIGAAGALYYGTGQSSSRERLDRLTIGCLVALGALACFQLLPLPIGFVLQISPQAGSLHQATRAVVPNASSWIPLSIVPAKTFQHLLTMGACVLTFLLVRALTIVFRDRDKPWVVVWPLLLVGMAEGALGFYQATVEGGPGFATGTIINRDHYAGFLEMIFPFTVFYPIAILQRDRNHEVSPAGPAIRACIVLLGGAVILLGIIQSLSRMAFIATLASLFLTGSLALSQRVSKRPWIPIVGIGLIVALVFVFLPGDALIARFADLARTEEFSADTRAQVWRESTALIKEYPLVGCGLGCYESAFLKHKKVAPLQTVDYAHNDYLQILIEGGWIGLGIVSLLVGWVVWSTARTVSFTDSGDGRFFALAALTALVAILLHSLMDFNLYRAANALTFAWVAGIAGSILSSNRRGRLPHKVANGVNQQVLAGLGAKN